MMKTKNRRRPLWALAVLGILLLLAVAGCGKRNDKPLEITGIFPADGAAEVPSNSAIEITFTVPPDKLDDYFTVEPAIDGRFQYMKEKVAYVPNGGFEGEWQSETTYTVTVKAGLPAKEGKGALAEDYTFTFTAQKEDALLYKAVNAYETFLPGDYPMIDLTKRSFWADAEERVPADGSFEVAVYRLESGEQYRNELYKAATYADEPRVDTGAMTPILTFTQGVAELTAAAQDQERSDWYLDIVFPEPLEQGWYVAQVTPSWGGQQPIQKLLQIQPSAVYTQTAGGEAVLWFNSTASGKPVSGARLEGFQDPFAGAPDITADGGEDGIVTLDVDFLTRGETDWAAKGRYQQPFLLYSLTAPDGTVYYDVLRCYSARSATVWQEYYGFLYTDRPIYHQDDTVKFWGVVKPRKNASATSTVRVELHHNWGAEAVDQQELPVSPDGIFTGEFTYKSLASGDLSVRAFLPEQLQKEEFGSSAVCTAEMSISQYKKPLYTAGITTDKLYYRPGETVQAEVSVSLFDGTPASAMGMNLTAGIGDAASYTTGEDGIIRARYAAALEEDPRAGWRPRPFVITGSNADASDVDLSVRDEVYVFPTAIMMEAAEKHDKTSSTLTVTTNSIDFTKIPGGRQIIQDYSALRGAPVPAEIQVDIRKVSYQRVELPSYYDRYTKTSVPRYAYQREEEIVDHRTGSNAQGVLVLEGLPVSSGLTVYYADISTTQGGAPQQTTVILGDHWNCSPEERVGHYHTFQVKTSLENEYYSSWYAMYRFGEEAQYQIMDNGLPVESGSVMTNLIQLRSSRAAVGGPVGTILCDEDTLPNFYLCGAYFDGTRIYPVKPISMEADPDSRSLNLQILPEKEDYQPGDTAQVTLKLTDENGRPVNGGNVCLGVVDEAIFAIQEQDLNMGNSLYSWVYYSYPEVTASYIQHGADLYYGEGGKGGGGGIGGVTIRENFQDTAAFLTGKTAADGTVTFRVELPDDLTQWRLTAVALDGRAYWGQSRSRLYTTLPFRIDPILSATYLSGDTIACTVRGFGTGITSGDTVEYTAKIDGYTQPLEVTATATAGETTPLAFQKLPAGDYSITVTARCGDYADSVKKPFTVRDSALTFPIHRVVDLEQEGLEGIQPTRWPVELEIYHRGQKPFMQAWRLLELDGSSRADTRLAMAAVRQTMADYYGEDYTHPETDTSDIQMSWEDGEYGALRLYSYSGADIRLSARAAVAVPELLNAGALENYLTYVETTDPTDQAAALMGVAALGNMGDDQRLQLETRARNGGDTPLEDAYLIAGLSYLDQTAAQKLYTQRIAPKLKEERGGLYIPENTAYDTVETTAAAMTCAILTGAADDAQKMLEYLSANATTAYGTMRGPCQLEAALYLNRFQLKESQLPTVTYTREGKRQSVTLPQSGCLRMTLTEAEFKALNLTAEGGGALAGVSYTGDPDQLNFTSSPRVVVTKTMDTAEDQKHLGGVTTVTIKVELDQSMPYGQYQLVEWVPTNMRLRSVVQEDEEGRKQWMPFGYRVDEQLLTVDFYHSQLDGNVFTLQYTATSVLDTECTLERSYAYCVETMEGGRTEKGEFLPSDYYYLGVGYLFRKE